MPYPRFNIPFNDLNCIHLLCRQDNHAGPDCKILQLFVPNTETIAVSCVRICLIFQKFHIVG